MTEKQRPGLDEVYMNMANDWAKRSRAKRKQVGALIVKDRQIISDGYNGRRAGSLDKSCEMIVDGVEVSRPDVVHAEANAIMKIAKNGGTGANGATIYVTMSPCLACANLINGIGISKVVYEEEYRDTTGIKFLKECGINIYQLKRDD